MAMTRDVEVDLQAALAALAPLSPSTRGQLAKLAQFLEVPRGGYFSRPGEPANRFAVVRTGLFRHFYTDARGRESVKAFRGAGDLIGAYAEMIRGQPSRTFIQALVDSEVLVFDRAAFDALAQDDLELTRLARRFVEEHFAQKEQREYEFLQLSAEERYRLFCEQVPRHLKDIPQHQIASYIGITPVALSRIRARLTKPAKRGRS